MEISMAKLIALIKALGGGGGGGGGGVSDVKVNGTSITEDDIANLILGNGLRTATNNSKTIMVYEPNAGEIREAVTTRVLRPSDAWMAVFYGLAKLAGDTTQAAISGNIGIYTENAKSAISQMLSAPETVSGSTPSITAKSGVQYICGEVSTIDIAVPESGIIDVIFESGSTPAVLTVTPPTGMTMKWAGGFDPTSLEANTTYEINIMNGCLGVGAAWT